MKRSPAELWSSLRSTYWFVPTLVTLAGVGLALGLLVVDLGADADTVSTVLYPSAAGGARSLLSAVIASMITVVSVTFSVNIVALTVASQHFGPRVLNSFMRDSAAQAVLGIFIATFTYCVLVLQSVQGPDESQEIPRVAVGGAMGLVLVSVVALIFYVHHVAQSLQVSTIAAGIAADLEYSLRRVASSTPPPPDGLRLPPEPDANAIAPVRAGDDGYVQSIDERRLCDLLDRRSAIGWVRRIPGDFVVTGTPILAVSPPEAVDASLEREVNQLYVIGTDRTPWQDPEFAIKQLVEIALRALSPGVNEPFTALTCIDRLGQGLTVAAREASLPDGIVGGSGSVRLVVPRQSFEKLVRAAFDPIRTFAGANPAIPARLLGTLALLAHVVSQPGHRAVLRHQVDVIWRTTQDVYEERDDRAFVEARHREALEALADVRDAAEG